MKIGNLSIVATFEKGFCFLIHIEGIRGDKVRQRRIHFLFWRITIDNINRF